MSTRFFLFPAYLPHRMLLLAIFKRCQRNFLYLFFRHTNMTTCYFSSDMYKVSVHASMICSRHKRTWLMIGLLVSYGLINNNRIWLLLSLWQSKENVRRRNIFNYKYYVFLPSVRKGRGDSHKTLGHLSHPGITLEREITIPFLKKIVDSSLHFKYRIIIPKDGRFMSEFSRSALEVVTGSSPGSLFVLTLLLL